jgi:hypothetical protein
VTAMAPNFSKIAPESVCRLETNASPDVVLGEGYKRHGGEFKMRGGGLPRYTSTLSDQELNIRLG